MVYYTLPGCLERDAEPGCGLPSLWDTILIKIHEPNFPTYSRLDATIPPLGGLPGTPGKPAWLATFPGIYQWWRRSQQLSTFANRCRDGDETHPHGDQL